MEAKYWTIMHAIMFKFLLITVAIIRGSPCKSELLVASIAADEIMKPLILRDMPVFPFFFGGYASSVI